VRFKNLIAAVASTVCLLTLANAQQQRNQPSDIDLALQVTYLKGTPPAYQRVTAERQKGGTWYSRFGRVVGWQLPSGDPTVKAVRIIPYLEGDTIRIVVSVLRGLKFQDLEDRVATYRRRENESVMVAALSKFGVEPFEIKVVRVVPQTSELPVLVNKTNAVQVISIEPTVSTFPIYALKLHNLSEKNICALYMKTIAENRPMTSMPQGKDGEPLIKARDSSELKQPLITLAQSQVDGFAPASPSSQQIVIASAVFEDGSYEGEVEPAAMYRAMEAGRMMELKRIVPVLESALNTPPSLEDLRMRITKLSYGVDEAEVDTLAEAFPQIGRPKLRASTEVTIHVVRKDLLDELKLLQQSEVSAIGFQAWLQRTKDRYSNWLSRLSLHNVSEH
jgi:hypothetical protein